MDGNLDILATCLLPVKVATRLFSGQELSVLRRDASFRRQVEEGLVIEVEQHPVPDSGGGEPATSSESRTRRRRGDPVAGGLKDRDPKDWCDVSWKSISLARNDMTGRREGGGQHATFPESCSVAEERLRGEPTQPEQSSVSARDATEWSAGGGALVKGRDGDGAKGTDGWDRGLAFRETEASAMRQHARRREDFILAGGAQNFYTSVRVCHACFRVSTSWLPVSRAHDGRTFCPKTQ